jgi:hypothetical protein
MLKKITELLTGVLLVLVTGIFWGTWFSLSRTMNTFSPQFFITIGKEIMENVAVPMSIFMPTSVVGLIILIIWSWRRKSVYFYCMILALILFIVAFVITVSIEVPIDDQIRTWTASSIPTDWEKIRDRWEWHHTIRTFAALGCIFFFLTGIINKKRSVAKPAKDVFEIYT